MLINLLVINICLVYRLIISKVHFTLTNQDVEQFIRVVKFFGEDGRSKSVTVSLLPQVCLFSAVSGLQRQRWALG